MSVGNSALGRACISCPVIPLSALARSIFLWHAWSQSPKHYLTTHLKVVELSVDFISTVGKVCVHVCVFMWPSVRPSDWFRRYNLSNQQCLYTSVHHFIPFWLTIRLSVFQSIHLSLYNISYICLWISSPPACLSVWMSNNISIHPSISSKLWIEQHASWSKFQTLKRNDSILRYISYRHKVGTIKQRRLSRLKEKVRDWVFVWKEEGWRGAAIYCEGGWAEGWVYLWETSSTSGEGKENEKGREWESVSDEVPRCCAELWNNGFSGSL